MVSPCTPVSLLRGAMPAVQVDAVLGRGGQAVVYAARRTGGHGFTQSVALKVTRDGVASEGALAREARLQAALQHRHIVSAIDLVRIDGALALVMERVGTHDLRTVARSAARRKDRSIRAVLEVGRDIAQALAHLESVWLPGHAEPVCVVHRDVKPANILVDAAGCARLTDFGVALIGDGDASQTHPIAGTCGYMAPEVARGQAASSASDVYALGATLLELLVLRRLQPKGSDACPPTDVIRRAIAELPFQDAPLRMAETARLLMDMLDPDPRRRPGAAKVVERLAELAHNAPGLALGPWCDNAVGPRGQSDPWGWVGKRLMVMPDTARRPAEASSKRHRVRSPETDVGATAFTISLFADLPPVPPVPAWCAVAAQSPR